MIQIPIVILIVLVVLVLAFWSRYKTIGADDAMIITGSLLGNGTYVYKDASGNKIKIVRGGGAFIFPIFQQYAILGLRSHKLNISTPSVYTENGVPVMADGTAIIKVNNLIEGIATAAEQFLGKSDSELQNEAREVLEGHLRAILGTMTVEQIYKNRDVFAQNVQEVATKDLGRMGLEIVSFTIKNVMDENGYLDALGQPRIAQVKRDAEVAQAQAIRDARIEKARADEDGEKAELLRDTNIAEATKDKELKVAAFKREQDTAKAEADMSYDLQKARSEQSVVSEQMHIEVVRKEKEIELEEQEISRREKQYDAEVKKKADADRYAVEQEAEAEKARTLRAAEADAELKKLDGAAQAEAHLVKGKAEADVIRLQGLAEAEAKEKIAEAFEKYGRAAILDMIVEMLPQFAGKIAEPMANIDKITVIDSGSGEQSDGAARVSNYVTKLMAQLPEMVKDVSGVDLQQMLQSIGRTTDLPPEKVEVESAPSSSDDDQQQ